MKKQIYQRIFDKLEKIGVVDVKEHAVFKAAEFMDLHVDVLSEDGNIKIIAMAHNGEQNGDVMADPDMQIKIYKSTKMAEALTFQNDYAGMYQEVYSHDGKFVNLMLRKELNSFLEQWLKNIIEQGHKKSKEDKSLIELAKKANEALIESQKEMIDEETESRIQKAYFAKLNKNNTLEEYKEECAKGEFHYERILVTEQVFLNGQEWKKFVNSFLSDNERIAGKGGCDSTVILPEETNDKELYQLTKEQQEAWKRHSFRNVVEIINTLTGEYIYVDPQGYNYSRYVGLSENGLVNPEYIVKKETRKYAPRKAECKSSEVRIFEENLNVAIY